MSNYEDITELEVNTKMNTKERSKWWEEEQVRDYHRPEQHCLQLTPQVFGLQDYQDYGWSDKLGLDNR